MDEAKDVVMKKQVFLFFFIFVALLSLAQVLFLYDGFKWQILLQSSIAGVISSTVFWLIIRKTGK